MTDTKQGEVRVFTYYNDEDINICVCPTIPKKYGSNYQELVLKSDFDAVVAERDALKGELAALKAENERLKGVYEAAKGLCAGVDFNNGTQAKIYRDKLIDAVKRLERK